MIVAVVGLYVLFLGVLYAVHNLLKATKSNTASISALIETNKAIIQAHQTTLEHSKLVARFVGAKV